MLTISSRAYYNDKNQFELREIYVSDGNETYVLRKSEKYTPNRYFFPIEDILQSEKSLIFSNLGFSPFRSYKDDDAKSLAVYIQEKVNSVNMNLPFAEKTLYEVLSSFGEELLDG